METPAGVKKLKIFSGSVNPALAERIAAYIGKPLDGIDLMKFPDGEKFVQVHESIRGCDVFVIQSACKSPDEAYMELFIMIDAIRRASAERITAVIPYYGYARQDRKDKPRVPITASLVAKLIEAAGADRVLCLDLHAAQIQGYFDIPVDHLHASPVFIKYLRGLNLPNPIVVSPDTGGVKTANWYSKRLGTGIGFVAKERRSGSDVEALNFVGDVAGKDVIMIDDMTSTCGTLVAAANILKAHGATSIRAAVSHAMLSEKGLKKLAESPICELIATDSIPMGDEIKDYPVTVLSVGELIGDAILRIHNDESVNSLFEV